MDTVSYLTINDETKEIADNASRNNIENITATLATYRSDIDDIQYETGSSGSIAASIGNAYSLAYSAQAGAVEANNAAILANEKAASAAEAANTAWAHADSASTAAANAWDRAGEANAAAIEAQGKAESASSAANTAWDQASNAASAATNAWNKANDAEAAAQLANTKADAASSSANAAEISARQANNYAQGALSGMSTLESVIDTVKWFADHRTLTTDTTVDPDKSYYTYDETTGTMSKAELFGTENPQQLGLYEIDETIQNYVASRIAETSDGLYISSNYENGWRILVSPGTDRYPPGIFLIDDTGIIKQSTTGAGISFDDKTPFYVGNENAYLTFARNNNNEGVINIGGDNVNINGAVNMGGSKTLSQVLNDLDSSITLIEYGVGNSNTSYTDIQRWSTTTPEWQEDKYIWMRTSTNGQTYTYTCIQGAQGPQGEKGDTGEPGAPGLDGLGILSVEVFYAISNSSEIIPEDNEWKTSLDQWYGYYEYDEEGETGITGLTGIISETGITGETGETYEEGETGETGEDFTEEYLLNLPKGSWLWVKTETTYSDFTSSVSYQKSYIGTDGQDGTSVFIQSADRDEATGTTTITLVDGKGTKTQLVIKDGEDGVNGTPGASGYIHIAWADEIEINQDESISATGFSIDDSTNKKYMGVYTDGIEGDSNNPSDYSWSLIKGADGTSVTVTNTDYSYQLSASGTVPPTGEWQTTPQAPTTTQYAWTRTITTYSDGNKATTYTVGGKAGNNGTSYYTHIRYGTSSTGAGMTATPTASTTYIGVYSGTSSTAPTTANSYVWSKYVGEKGDKGDQGETGPEAIVTITPTTINWNAGTATLAVILRVNGVVTTPKTYNWTKGASTDSLGTESTLTLNGSTNKLDSTYNCTVTW